MLQPTLFDPPADPTRTLVDRLNRQSEEGSALLMTASDLLTKKQREKEQKEQAAQNDGPDQSEDFQEKAESKKDKLTVSSEAGR